MAVSMLPDSVAYARLLALPYDKIAALVQGGRRGPNAVTVRCPCPDHDDKRPSCTISRGEKKPWVATCPRCGDAVLHALLGLARDRGLLDEDEADHRPPGKGQFADIATLRRHMLAMLEPSNGPIEQWQVFTYHDQIARAVGVSIRFEAEGGKIIRPGRRTTGGWELGAPQAPRPLYRLPQLNGTPVFIVEGEPCADALVALGLDATTSFGGSSAWKQTDWSSLSGYGAVILPDADEPGRKYAEGVAEVTGAEIAALPGFEQRDDGSDVVDWIAARRVAGALERDTYHWTEDRDHERDGCAGTDAGLALGSPRATGSRDAPGRDARRR